ncbi:hypothetical protein Tco_0047310 [Tanacetum coccineum]
MGRSITIMGKINHKVRVYATRICRKLRSYDAARDGFVANSSGVYDTYGGCKGGYLAKGTSNRVWIRAKDSSGYCYRCLVKGYPFEVNDYDQHGKDKSQCPRAGMRHHLSTPTSLL